MCVCVDGTCAGLLRDFGFPVPCPGDHGGSDRGTAAWWGWGCGLPEFLSSGRRRKSWDTTLPRIRRWPMGRGSRSMPSLDAWILTAGPRNVTRTRRASTFALPDCIDQIEPHGAEKKPLQQREGPGTNWPAEVDCWQATYNSVLESLNDAPRTDAPSPEAVRLLPRSRAHASPVNLLCPEFSGKTCTPF